MKYFSKIISLCILFCLICCVVPALAGAESSAAQPVVKNQTSQPGAIPPGNNDVPPKFGNDTAFQERMVKDLESRGIDTTELKAAIATGDKAKINSVMEGLKDKMPQPPMMNGTSANNTAFEERMVKDLESQGVDTTELKAAIASGDQTKIRSVMDGLRDKMPRPSMNGTPGKEAAPQGNNAPQQKPGEKQTPAESKSVEKPAETSVPQPTQTKSPLSPLTIIAGIGAAGLAIVSLKRQ